MNERRNLAIARRVQELVAEGRQVLVCVEQILHGQTISRIAKIPFVYSGSKDRVETIETFKKGYTRALVTTLLDEGFDLPSISAVVMAGGRKTKIGTIQKVGRALRPDPKFDNAIIVDFADRGRHLSDHAVARYNTYVETYGAEIVLKGRKKK
jgi:superfamily II DNA or RNA helicase